jgi:hypothetical protein
MRDSENNVGRTSRSAAGLPAGFYGIEHKLIGHILAADWSINAKRTWPDFWFNDIDWNKLTTLTWQHKLRPMMLAALQEAGWPGIPGDVRERIEQDARTCSLKSIHQLELLRALHAAAKAAEIRILALKGLPLSLHLYGDPFIREAYDLDLMTAPTDHARMKRILQECGCRPIQPEDWLTPRQNAILARFQHEDAFVHDNGTMVELHRAVDPNPWRLSIDFEDIWRQRQSVQIGQHKTAIPGNRDLVLFLGIHAARHAWGRWKWVGDLVVLYRRSGPQELLRQRARAQADGLLHYFDSALLIASAITGRPLPAELADPVARNQRAIRLSRRALRFSIQEMTPKDVGRHGLKTREMIFVLGLNHHPMYLLHEFLAMVHRRRDWFSLRLPDYLIPVYYLLRPFSYIWRRVPQLVRLTIKRPRGI